MRVLLFCLILLLQLISCNQISLPRSHQVGDVVDSLNGVKVYYNGEVGNVDGRNVSEDGYNLGLKYQCVEFVKRYYFEHLHHKMPDSYGHAVDFYDKSLSDGVFNKRRALFQHSNPSKTKPKVNDLVIFDGHSGNIYGHVAIISAVSDEEIEIIQQNPGPNGNSRATFNLKFENNLWTIDNDRILGWLCKQ